MHALQAAAVSATRERVAQLAGTGYEACVRRRSEAAAAGLSQLQDRGADPSPVTTAWTHLPPSSVLVSEAWV
jgi:hypothetical protein